MPPAPWDATDYLEYGKIRGFFDERFQSLFQWGSHSFVMLDLERGRGRVLGAVGGADPLLRDRRRRCGRCSTAGSARVASSSSTPRRSAPATDASSSPASPAPASRRPPWLPRRPGSGVLADDYCLVGPGTPTRVASIYSSAKTRWADISTLPFLSGDARGPGARAATRRRSTSCTRSRPSGCCSRPRCAGS